MHMPYLRQSLAVNVLLTVTSTMSIDILQSQTTFLQFLEFFCLSCEWNLLPRGQTLRYRFVNSRNC